ncbi:hypothetical protein WDZ17_15890 [Pseudokineococcus basanitobsidens]|uniref:Uncharacterized protein n=1 Tax=Pseudokineococcus basanitobsidens TaxID=1926649 RepID=A0ABU8RNY5_9ACTN
MSVEPGAAPSHGAGPDQPGRASAGGAGAADEGDVAPLHAGDPTRLGPFGLVGRLHAAPAPPSGRGPQMTPAAGDPAEAAAVFAAHGPDGAPVRVVLLGAGPSGDAAARDRFAAAVRGAGARGRVLTASLEGPWPWAATAAGDARTAGELAGSPLVPPGPAVDGDVRGPAYSPHWSGGARPLPATPTGAPTPGAPGRPRDRRPWVLSAVLGLLLLAALLLLLTGACEPDRASAPTPSPSSAPSAQPSPQPSPTPSPSPGTGGGSGDDGTPAPGEEGSPLLLGPGVVGPSFGPGDDTEVLTLDGLPFSFRVPAGWTCERAPLEEVVRYDCSAPTGDAGGFLQLQPCPAPCGEASWFALQDLLAPGATWFPVDVTTVAAEDSAPGREASYRLRMSHLLVAGERESSELDDLDTHLYAEFWSSSEDREQVQAVVNDLRANTP